MLKTSIATLMSVLLAFIMLGCGSGDPEEPGNGSHLGKARQALTTTTIDWGSATHDGPLRIIDQGLPVGPPGYGAPSGDTGICGFSHIEGTFDSSSTTTSILIVVGGDGYYHFFGMLDWALEVPVIKIVCAFTTDFSGLGAGSTSLSNPTETRSTSGTGTTLQDSTICVWAGFAGELSKEVSSNLNQAWARAVNSNGTKSEFGAQDSSSAMTSNIWCSEWAGHTWSYKHLSGGWSIDSAPHSTTVPSNDAFCYLEGVGQNWHHADLSQHFVADISQQTIGGSSVWGTDTQYDSELRWNCVNYAQ